MGAKEIYSRLLQESGGDYGEAFNRTENARSGVQMDPALKGLSPQELAEVNRVAQGADVPVTALLAAPYEALKGIEQNTGIPALTGPGKLLNKMGVPVALPKENTSRASLANVKASLSGALMRGLGMLGG